MPDSSARPAGPRPRVALYSHDAQGLGHLRRNLAVAQAVAGDPPVADVLLLTGVAEAGLLPRPAGADLLVLPGICKGEDGAYRARRWGGSAAAVCAVRAAVLEAAVSAFVPDLLVVDKHPRGACGELEPTLDRLRQAGRARVVLGLRDVLDDPARAAREWRRDGCRAALERWYHGVWVYGDPAVHDVRRDVDLAVRLPAGVSFTGYLSPAGSPHRPPGDTGRDRLLCLVGGGDDGGPLAATFAATPFPPGWTGEVVLGPQMPVGDRDRVHRLAGRRHDLRVHDACWAVDRLLDRAAAVVTMGGYNSLCEALPHGVPTCVVPRVHPRREQLVRAQAFARHGLVDVVHPARLAPEVLASWLDRAVTVTGPVPPRARVDVGGLSRVAALAGVARHPEVQRGVAV